MEKEGLGLGGGGGEGGLVTKIESPIGETLCGLVGIWTARRRVVESDRLVLSGGVAKNSTIRACHLPNQAFSRVKCQ